MSLDAAPPPFRVIVVGGGVTGLVASHCLQKAGIKHVVLERRKDVAPPEGASIAMYPHGARILHQLGCLEAIQSACVPGDRWVVRLPNGRKIMDNGFFRHLETNHGSSLLLLERREFLQVLYDSLPDKSHIRTECAVRSIKHTKGGVEVMLSNGEVEFGNIVLGCDGVYSTVRSMMWDHANTIMPGSIDVKEKKTMRTAWKSLLGIAPMVPELGERDMTVVSHKGHSFLSLSQPDRVYFFFIFRVDEPFTWPKRTMFTDRDAEELAESVADLPISDSMLFGELWRRRLRGGLVSLEEGVLSKWHAGRIVLAGDSAHKVTPNIALGGNAGMESVAVLCNHLHRLLVECGGRGTVPGDGELERIFEAYQAERIPRMKQIYELSSLVTKVQAWDTPLHRFLGTWVFPLQPDTAVADQIGALVRSSPKLEYVEDTGFTSGRMAWEDQHRVPETPPWRTLAASPLARLLGAAAAFMLVFHGVRAFAFASTAASY